MTDFIFNLQRFASMDNILYNTSVTGTSYADSIVNYGQQVTVEALSGNDTIENYGSPALILGGMGKDYILNEESQAQVSIYGGEGNDTIITGATYNLASGDDGNDLISLTSVWASYTTVKGGKGNDTIQSVVRTHGSQFFFDYSDGDGNDVIYQFSADDTIRIGNGTTDTYSRETVGSDVIVRVGEGAMTLKNAASLKNIIIMGNNNPDFNVVNLSDGDDTYENTSVGLVIKGNGGNDTIQNSTDYATIKGGTGNDSLTNEEGYNWYVLLDGEEGDDTLVSHIGNTTLLGGADNDYIKNSGSNAKIDGGTGFDSITNISDKVSINAGAGDDYISLHSSATNNLIEYSSGDGFDTIDGFNDSSTLSISDEGTFSTMKSATSGTDVIVTVDGQTILLRNAAGLPKLNIFGSSNNPLIVKLTEGNDTYTNNTQYATIKALGGDDSINNQSSNVLVDAGNGNDTIYNSGQYVTINATEGNNQITAHGDYVTINAGDGDDTINGGYTTNAIINAGGGNNYIAPHIRNASITAGDGNDTIEANIGDMTIDAGDGNNSIRSNIYSETYAEGLVSIRAGSGDDSVEIHSGRNANVNLGDGNNYVYAEGYFNYSGTNTPTEISIVSGTGNDLFSIRSQSNSTISIDAGAGADSITFVTPSAGVSLNAVIADMGDGDDSIANLISNLTLKGGAGNDSIDPYGGYDSSDSVKNVSIDAGDGDDYFYVKKSLQNSTVEMGAGNDSIVNWNASNLVFKDVFFSFGTGDDYFSAANSVESSTIDMGDGNDSIMFWNSNSLKDVSIAAGAGVDSIVFNQAEDLTVDGGADDDNIYITSSSSVSVDGGAGNDSLYVVGSHVTAKGGDGNDTLVIGTYYGTGEDLHGYGGTGSDTLITYGNGATLDGEADDDYLVNYNTKTMLIGGDGNDTLRNEVEDKYSATKKQDDSTLDAGDGNDTLYNGNYKNVSMSGGAGVDSITNNGEKATINAGAGDDYISLSSTALDNVIEYASGDGDDTIEGFSSSTTLSVSGDDEILTVKSGSDVLVTVGDKTILLKGAAQLSTINIAGDGFNPKKIIGTDDKNSIDNALDDATIQAKGDDDTINSFGARASIDAGDGNDNIHGAGTDATISGGAGNDFVTLATSAANNLIVYNPGDGTDTVSGFNATSTLKIGDGLTDTYTRSIINRNDILISLRSAGSVLLVGAAALDNVNIAGREVDSLFFMGTDDADNFDNRQANATIDALGGNDLITNDGKNVSVNAGDGNDTIKNGSSYSYSSVGAGSTLLGGDGDDSIVNYSNSVSIDGGEGNDTIYNDDSYVSISGGDGDDSIVSNGGNVNGTINAGKGNDTIHNFAKNALIKYSAGDGSDTIINFNDDDSIKIGDGSDTYSTLKSGSDVVVYVGEETILLKGAASLSAVNILGSEVIQTSVTLTESDDTYTNNHAGVTVSALGGDDKITNNGANASISGGDGNDTFINNTTGEGSTLDGGEGNDSISNSGDNVSINGGLNNDTIINEGDSVTIDGDAGNDSISLTASATDNLIVYNPGEGNDIVEGFNEDDTLQIGDGTEIYTLRTSGNNIIVSAGTAGSVILKDAASLANINIAGEEYNSLRVKLGEYEDFYTNNNANVTVLARGGNDSIVNYGANVLIDGSAGNDTLINAAGDNSTLLGGEGNDFIYNQGQSVTIDGGDGNDTLVTNALYTSVFGGEGDDVISLDASSNVTTTLNGGKGNDTIYGKFNSQNPHILFEYSAGDGNDEIHEFNAGDTLKIGDGTATYYTATVGTDVVVHAGDGSVVLKGAASLASVNIAGTLSNPSLVTGTAGDDTLKSTFDGATITAGAGDDLISLSAAATNNLIVYNDGDGSDTVEGFNATSTLKIGNGTDTYSYAIDGDDITVIVGEGSILLKGAATLDNVNILGTSKTIALTDGDDSINVTVDGATISTGAGSDTITVGEGVTSLTVTDFAAGDAIELNATVETISVENDSLVAGSVTIGGIDSVSKEEISWTLDDGTAIYGKETSAGAKLSDDGKTITFASAANETLLTIDGLDADLTAEDLTAGVTIDGNKIILSADVLAKENVTLTTDGDYALELDDDCPTVTDVEKSWILDGTTATLHDAGKSEGYELTNAKTVTYTPAVVGENLLTVTGVAGNLSADELSENLTLDGNVLTVKPNAVGDNFSVPAGYKVVFASGDYDGLSYVGTDGKDTVEVRGTGLSLDLGAGNDTVTSSVDGGGNIYLFGATSGKDVIVGFGDGDTIKITDDSQLTPSVKGHDIIVKAGTATMTLKDAADGTQVKIVDADNATLLDQTFFANRIVDGDWVLLNADYGSRPYATDEDFPNVDASAVSKKLTLTGGADDNEIVGGKGADLITGSAGSNTLTGGRGNDTFAYGGGSDTITDYGTGSDKISLGTELSAYEIDDDGNLILKVNGGSVTILDGVDKKITLLDDRTTSLVFTRDGIWNATKTAVTLTAETSEFAADDSELVTIDGSLAEDGISIVGNAKNNKIFGGEGSDILNGSAGNDTLTGNGGADVFVFESGKDVVADYSVGDKISLGAAVTSESVNNRGDVILKFDTNSLTIKKVGDTDGLALTFADDTTKTYFSEKIVTNNGVTLLSSFAGTYAADAANPKVDASAVGKKITLTGGDENNTLIGGKGANLIDGGDGSDLLIGNGGSDTFVYSSGDDTISDYGNGSDKISLGAAVDDFNFSGDDLIIVFADGSLTLKDAVDKKISFIEGGRTRVNIFAAEGIFDGKQTAVTLDAATTAFDAADFDKLTTIDGGLATGAIEIVGNAKNNKIFAGDNGSTLTGGAGNDSLWGGDGSDTFIYDGGKDVIVGFGNGDALQLGDDFTAAIVGETISFKVGTTAKAVTLKNYSATSFNVNGDDYEIDNGAFVRK